MTIPNYTKAASSRYWLFLQRIRHSALACLPLLLAFWLSPLSAQSLANEPVTNPDDTSIEERLTTIYSLLDALTGVEVEVEQGVVLLSGTVSNQNQAERALSLATQIPGVFTVEDGIQRRLDVEGNLTPLVARIKSSFSQWVGALPLIGLAILIFAIVTYLGHALARWSSLWRRLTPNSFVAELIGQAVQAVAVLLGVVVALNLLGATTVMATILGGAGVIGLAIGFSVRDTIENYISSIMLSLRQPFRANDHVVINEHEGKVVRLTSRATILMTLDGNQLRIPNATVFKSVILNYTHNPERRFQFELGVDGNDDPIAAIKVGVEALASLSFVLDYPEAKAVINKVGDSSIILTFMGWINQQETDFGKARSLAICAAKNVLEKEGFTLPEPVYKLRFDADAVRGVLAGDHTNTLGTKDGSKSAKSSIDRQPIIAPNTNESMDVRPDKHLEEMVNEERAIKDESDLLDEERPVE